MKTQFSACGYMWVLIHKDKKLTVNFSKEMLILALRFYILNFTETKSVYSLSGDKQLKFKLAVYWEEKSWFRLNALI